MTVLFVTASLLALAAPFLLYPMALFIRAHWAPRPFESTASFTPKVDLIICAHNEAAAIGDRIENALALDYPREHLRIIVASDGSTDATVTLAGAYRDRGVVVLDLPRAGKARALAAAAEVSEAPILAFSDANSEWAPDALRALMAPLSNPEIGGVAGDQQYRKTPDQGDTAGERSYWQFDRILKRWQSRAGSAISATGAIYAIRTEHFSPPPPDATDDFMISTGVIAAGRRLVFSEDARAFESPADKTAGEFRRKVRIITRGLRAVVYRRDLLNPARTGAYAFELLLHKVLRRLTWIPCVALVLVTPLCWQQGGWLTWLAGGVLVFLALALLGLTRPGLSRRKPFNLAAYIVMVQAACAVATLATLRGHRVSRWETERPGAPASDPPS